MTKNYVFDIGKSEFKDDYSDGVKGELWQDYAKEQLVLNLDNILSDAKEYAHFRNNKKFCRDNGNETWLSHNAILVTSQRGSGKTVFLRNSKAMWAESKKDTSELFFLKVIDPTMLMANDSFANVIVAQIYDAVSQKLNKLTCCDDKSKRDRDTFHRYLKKLADSMGKTSEFNGSIGIDKILKYSSGIHLEANFHNFVESAIELLGCKAIAVLIDDVDMALDKAFEVVDDVRRFLGCPYIIPVVSGELKLYEHMTQNHFDEKAYDNRCRDINLRAQGKQFSKELKDAYLTKVFPASMRISLFSVERLLSKMIIKYPSNKEISYSNYLDSLLNQFYYLRHNIEACKNWPELSSAREFTQLVRTLTPNDLDIEDLTTAEEIALYNRLKNWAVQKKSGEVMALSETAITVLHNNYTHFDISNLLAFNIKRQIDSNLYHWAEFKPFESQKVSLNSRGLDSEENLIALNSVFKQNHRSLQSMPPLELIYSQLFITKDTFRYEEKVAIQKPLKNLKKIKGSRHDILLNEDYKAVDCSIHNVLKDIYTESQVYSKLNNEQEFVFFSRAFELIVLSFLKTKDDMSQVESIYQILSRKPFYSLIKLAETKIAIMGESELDLYDVLEDTTSKSAAILFSLITDWQEKHSQICLSGSKARYIAILSYTFNSVFTALNVIKGNLSNGLGGENLTDMILRFKYNLLNSIVRAGIYGEAIQANVLVWAKPTTIRSTSKINNSERTYTRNLKKLTEQIESCNEDEIVKKEKLLETLNLHDAVSEHPVFSIFMDSESNVLTMLPIGKQLRFSNNNTQKKKVTTSEVEAKGDKSKLAFHIGDAASSVAILREKIGKNHRSQNKIESELVKLLSGSNITSEVREHWDVVIKAQRKLDDSFFNGQEINLIKPENDRNFLKAVHKLGNSKNA